MFSMPPRQFAFNQGMLAEITSIHGCPSKKPAYVVHTSIFAIKNFCWKRSTELKFTGLVEYFIIGQVLQIINQDSHVLQIHSQDRD